MNDINDYQNKVWMKYRHLYFIIIYKFNCVLVRFVLQERKQLQVDTIYSNIM